MAYHSSHSANIIHVSQTAFPHLLEGLDLPAGPRQAMIRTVRDPATGNGFFIESFDISYRRYCLAADTKPAVSGSSPA